MAKSKKPVFSGTIEEFTLAAGIKKTELASFLGIKKGRLQGIENKMHGVFVEYYADKSIKIIQKEVVMAEGRANLNIVRE